jgi:protein-cysteine N-palmitoyltransferase HHAT
MNILLHIRSLYSLDTLDTRFTASNGKDPVAEGRSARSPDGAPARDLTAGEGTRASEISSSLWGTTEFYLYYAVFIVAIPLMFKVANDVSNREFKADALDE